MWGCEHKLTVISFNSTGDVYKPVMIHHQKGQNTRQNVLSMEKLWCDCDLQALSSSLEEDTAPCSIHHMQLSTHSVVSSVRKTVDQIGSVMNAMFA